MSAPRKSILLVGAAGFPPGAPAPPNAPTPEQIKKGVGKSLQDAADRGYDAVSVLIDLQDPSPLDSFRAKLREKSWDIVDIGFGVRGVVQLTPLFEGLVNASLEEISPPPKFIFQTTPDGLSECLDRMFGPGK